MKQNEPVLMKAQGKTDIHYFWLPQESPVQTVCGVDCSDFRCTNNQVNCPDCRDKIDGLIDAGMEKVLVTS